MEDSFWSARNDSGGTLNLQTIKEAFKRKPTEYQPQSFKFYLSPTEYDLWKQKSPRSIHYRSLGPIERYL